MIIIAILMVILAVWLLSGVFLHLIHNGKETLGDYLWTRPGEVIVHSIPRMVWLLITIAAITIWAVVMGFGLWLYIKIFCERQDSSKARDTHYYE